MPNELVPRKPQQDMAQVEQADQRMHNKAEFDNLKADIRMSHGRSLTMPWRTGRAPKVMGTNLATGLPLTPLDVLDLKAVTDDIEKTAIANEMNRVVLHDAVSEGVLDQAERQGVSLIEEAQWWELDEQLQADEAEAAKQLKGEQ